MARLFFNCKTEVSYEGTSFARSRGPGAGRRRRAEDRRDHHPDTAKEKPQQGKVIAVGNGRVNDKGEVLPLDVKAGDTVLFGKYSGTEIKVDGTEYLIVREDEILGVVEGVRELASV